MRMPVASWTYGLLVVISGSYAIDSTFTREGPVKRAGRWYLAPTVNESNYKKDQFYPSHNRTMPYARGLPEGCVTYKDKVQPYRKLSADFGSLNLKNPKADRAVLVRIHHGLEWTKDLQVSMRALVVETAKAGWHVWFLQQATVGQQPLQKINPVDFLTNIPTEFHPFVYSYTAEELHTVYPHSHKYLREGNSGYSEERGDYMATALFLRRYSAYEFAFILEFDVRWIGDWGQFFSSTLHIALQTIREGHLMASKPTKPHLTFGSHAPDFIMFSDALYDFLPPDGPDNGVRANPQFRFPQAFKEMVSIYGVSQKAVHEIHKNSVLGNAGYIEEFIPTLAAYENLSVVIVPLGEWNNIMALHCCTDKNEAIYNEWLLSKQCHTFTLLHPVKHARTSVEDLGRFPRIKLL